MFEDENMVRRIALETADSYATRTEKKIDALHGRVTDLATNVEAIKTRVSLLPDRGSIYREIKECKADHAAKASLSVTQWLKIVSLVLSVFIAAKGVEAIIPDTPVVAKTAKP